MLFDISTPPKERKFWLSDYIYENRQSEGKKPLVSKYGIARRMPRINKRNEKLFEDTLRVIAKEGETSQIVMNFQETPKSSHWRTISPRKNKSISVSYLNPETCLNKFKKMSGDLIEKIKTEDSFKQCEEGEEISYRSKKERERIAFRIKASDEWMKTQKQILKINFKQELSKLEKIRLKKIQMGADNRSIQQLLNQIKK